MLALFHILSLVLYLFSFVVYWRYFATKEVSTGKIATGLLSAGLLSNTILLVWFTIHNSHLPLAQFGQAAMTYVWLLGSLYLIQEFLLKEREFGLFVTPILAVFQLVSVLTIDYTKPLAPVLRTVAFEIHVVSILLAYAGFALGFIAALMYLLLFNEIHGHRFGLFYSRLPSLEFLDKLNIRSIFTGLVFLTIGILIGMFNAGRAWGFVWEWDPKLTVVFFNWLIYMYFAVSYWIFKWRGQRTAIISVIGFIVVIFSFFIVTNYSSTIHTF